MRKRLQRISDRGAAVVEYALLLALIAVVCMGALAYVGHQADSKLGDAKLKTALDITTTTTAAPTTTTTNGGGNNGGGNNGGGNNGGGNNGGGNGNGHGH
jgi:Flp pilus assembly pilin Flp